MQGFFNRKQIRAITGGRADSTIWRWERAGIFPRRRQIGPHSVGWAMEEVEDWVSSKLSSPDPIERDGES